MQQLLSDAAYASRYLHNKTEAKAQKFKPEDQWVRIAIDPLVDRHVFAAVAAKRPKGHARSGRHNPPSYLANQPALLQQLRRRHDGCHR